MKMGRTMKGTIHMNFFIGHRHPLHTILSLGKTIFLIVLVEGVVVSSAPVSAWEIKTHIELTDQAINIKAGVLLLKVAALLSFLGGVFLVSRIALLVRPETEATALIFFGANPLVLLEGPGMGHNELAAITAVLLSVWLFLNIIAGTSAKSIRITASPTLTFGISTAVSATIICWNSSGTSS